MIWNIPAKEQIKDFESPEMQIKKCRTSFPLSKVKQLCQVIESVLCTIVFKGVRGILVRMRLAFSGAKCNPANGSIVLKNKNYGSYLFTGQKPFMR